MDHEQLESLGYILINCWKAAHSRVKLYDKFWNSKTKNMQIMVSK